MAQIMMLTFVFFYKLLIIIINTTNLVYLEDPRGFLIKKIDISFISIILVEMKSAYSVISYKLRLIG